MSIKQVSLLKKHADVIIDALVRLQCKLEVYTYGDKKNLEKYGIDPTDLNIGVEQNKDLEIAIRVMSIVRENENVIVLPERDIDLIKYILRYCILDLTTTHLDINPFSISEEVKDLLIEIRAELKTDLEKLSISS